MSGLRFILLMSISFGFLMPIASAGHGGESGGGEPGAIEFVSIGRKFINWLDSHPNGNFTKREAEYVLSQLSAGLNSDDAKQFLVFTNAEVFCELEKGAVSKTACSSKTGVLINRPAWIASSDVQKLTIVVLELLKLMDKSDRYETALKITREAKSIFANTDVVKSQSGSKRDTGLPIADRSLTLTLNTDITVNEGNDMLFFFNGKMIQTTSNISLVDHPREKGFGPAAVVQSGYNPSYRSCFIWLKHGKGGVLRKGRSFRAVLGLMESDGQNLTGSVDDLGYLACSNVQTPESMDRYLKLRVSYGTPTKTLTLKNIAPYFGKLIEVTVDQTTTPKVAREF